MLVDSIAAAKDIQDGCGGFVVPKCEDLLQQEGGKHTTGCRVKLKELPGGQSRNNLSKINNYSIGL